MLNLEKIVSRIKKSDIAIIIGILIFLAASFSTLYQGYELAKTSYLSSIGYKSFLLSNISKLTAGENFDYFKSVLGPPVFTNKINDRITEYIFVFKYCFVQAIVKNSSDSVVMYSITTREKDFNPVFRIWNGRDDWLSIVLGKSTFTDLTSINYGGFGNGQFDNSVYLYVGAHDWSYAEKYWLGNAGNYQSYIFADNMSGYENWNGTHHSDSFNFPYSTTTNDSDFQRYRKMASINTYAITAPFIFLDKEIGFTNNIDGLIIGPDFNQIRILPDVRQALIENH